MTLPVYQPLPSSLTYPPSRNEPPFPFKASSRRSALLAALKYLLGTAGALLVLHYCIIGAFPSSSYTARFRQAVGHTLSDATQATESTAEETLSQLDPAAGQPGTFFRDSYPIRSMLAFWDLAEREVKARGLNSCNGQLGRGLIDAYHSSQLAYCLPPGAASKVEVVKDGEVNETRIWCAPVHHNAFSSWWPFPAAPCLSNNVRAVADESRKLLAVGCELTIEGQALYDEMGRERFLGNDMDRVNEEGICEEVIDRTLVIIGRQDQWNPFHVAEDLITTLVSVFIAASAAPELVHTRVQLVFSEGFGMDANHFTPLWDRMGAWAPRRLSLDPWGKNVCLTNTIHSVGAGASLLSAMGVGSQYSCASSITWAASHYYRHLFGLLPQSFSLPANTDHRAARRPVNVLWISRAKLDNFAQKHDDWSTWREIRHIYNEKELIGRLRNGLEHLCVELGCVFEDARNVPESWALTSPVIGEAQPPVRFMTLDPTVHALESQIHIVGHSTILVSSHGGALGLSLFLPPGNAAIVELQVGGVRGNYHAQHMAVEMGHQYECLEIDVTVDVDLVWAAVEKWTRQLGNAG